MYGTQSVVLKNDGIEKDFNWLSVLANLILQVSNSKYLINKDLQQSRDCPLRC